MSISSVGGATSAGASQYLAELLSRLNTSSSTTSTSTTTSSTASSADCSNAATGAQAPTLSDQVIGALVMMQLQGSTPSSSSSGSGDPIAQAFSGLDTNGDGTISQSELESAIENAGGTADQADTVFSALGGTSSSGISQDAFKQAAMAGRPEGHHGHHHGDHGGPPPDAASASASGIFSSIDSNQDGSISSNELSTALSNSTAASASSSSSSDMFNAMDSNGDGVVSQNELSSYLDSLQKQTETDQAKLASFMQMATQSYGSALNLFSQNSGTQSAVT
jgi:Ca2+-binding EF-hand superfamily protein